MIIRVKKNNGVFVVSRAAAVHLRHDAFWAAFSLAALSGIMLGGPSVFLF